MSCLSRSIKNLPLVRRRKGLTFVSLRGIASGWNKKCYLYRLVIQFWILDCVRLFSRDIFYFGMMLSKRPLIFPGSIHFWKKHNYWR